jgi:hypothetical protein
VPTGTEHLDPLPPQGIGKIGRQIIFVLDDEDAQVREPRHD